MNFNTHYERPHKTPKEINHGPKLVNTLGYVPLHIKVKQLLNAGRILQEIQAGYDFEGDNFDEEYYATTRRPNYDMADAYQDNQRAMAEIKRQAVANASKKAVEPKKQDEPASGKDGENKPV